MTPGYMSEGWWVIIYDKHGHQWFLKKNKKVLYFDSEDAAYAYLEE